MHDHFSEDKQNDPLVTVIMDPERSTMAFKRGICPTCGHVVDLPEEAEAAYCPECGAGVHTAEAFAAFDEMERQAAQIRRQQEAAQQQRPRPQSQRQPQRPSLSPFASDSIWQRDTGTPFLAQWKTDALFTCLGLALRFMVVWTIINLTGGQTMIDTAMETGVLTATPQYIVASGFLDLMCAIAAFIVIPKRFRPDFQGKNYLVSFTNTLIGGIIFGLYWNSRLIKRRMGVSHLVFFVLLATNGISSIIMLMLS